MSEAVLLYTLFGGEDEARDVARTLVEEGLVGCANIGAAVTSIYRWQGKVEEEREIPALFKLAPAMLEEAKARLAELHSYEEPAILHWPAGTTAGYGAWLAADA